LLAKIVIVGAGPAGIRAAEVLAGAGLQPVVLDEARQPGGQIYRQPPPGAERDAFTLYGSEAGKARNIHAAFGRLGKSLDYRPDTLVWNCSSNALNILHKGRQGIVPYDRLLIATGAFDRVIPFPGWTLPGVFTLGGAQIALKAQGVSIGKRVALIGAGPLLPLVASQYLEAGADVAAVLDVTPFGAKIRALRGMLAVPEYARRGLSLLLKLKKFGVPTAYDVRAIEVTGNWHVDGLKWRDGAGRWHRIACDAVAASFGLKPEMQLADLAGCATYFDEATRQWLPSLQAGGRSSVPDVYLAGDCAAIGGADVAELTGKRAAYSVLRDLGIGFAADELKGIETTLARHTRLRKALDAAYPFPTHLIDAMSDSLTLCRCEGVTVGELRASYVKTSAPDVNRLKAFTRVGMGRCQGRVCGAMAAEILAGQSGASLPDVGRLRGQHPIKPIPMVV